MLKSRQITRAAAFAASAAFSLLSGCASTASVNFDLGTPADGRSYDRMILIRENAKFINVQDGEVVKFVVQEPDGGDKSFTRRFDAARETAGDLSRLAPAGVLGRPVKVYVGFNPRYY
jgi:hypothetical protein